MNLVSKSTVKEKYESIVNRRCIMIFMCKIPINFGSWLKPSSWYGIYTIYTGNLHYITSIYLAFPFFFYNQFKPRPIL